MRYSVWQSVKAAETHSRAGQAGTIHAVNPEKPDEVQVKWDVDGTIEAVATADLINLNLG